MTDDPQPAAIQLLVPGIELPARSRRCGRCREEIGGVDRPRRTVATDGGVQHDVTGFGERLGGPVPQPDVLGCLREREARVADEQHTRIRPRARVARAEERRRPRVPVMIGVGDPLVATALACPAVRRPERIADEGAVARVRVGGLGRGHGRVLLEDAQPLGRAPLVVEIRRVPRGGARNGIPEPAGALRRGGISPVRRRGHRHAGRRHHRRQQHRHPDRTAAANDHGSSPRPPWLHATASP